MQDCHSGDISVWWHCTGLYLCTPMYLQLPHCCVFLCLSFFPHVCLAPFASCAFFFIHAESVCSPTLLSASSLQLSLCLFPTSLSFLVLPSDFSFLFLPFLYLPSFFPFCSILSLLIPLCSFLLAFFLINLPFCIFSPFLISPSLFLFPHPLVYICLPLLSTSPCLFCSLYLSPSLYVSLPIYRPILSILYASYPIPLFPSLSFFTYVPILSTPVGVLARVCHCRKWRYC